jgi:hypothetical protein
MDLPVYRIVVNEDDDTGVEFVSLVDKPAIQKDFLAFNERQRYAIQSEEKRIVTGPAMLADLPIYRYDDQRGEYYVTFDAPTIWTIAKKFVRTGSYKAVNTDHADIVDSGVHMIESYFIDRERGVMPPKGYEDAKDGSWFMSYLVDNNDIWANIKDGKWKGFSVEGLFDMEYDRSIETMLQEINQLLRNFT